MNASELLTDKGKTVISVQLGEPLRVVTQILAEHKIGVVVVKDANGRLAGIISERDFMWGLEKFGPELMDKRVDELLTPAVITCAPDDNIVEIMWAMEANAIRHLPVVDGEELVGMISIRDVMGAWLDASEEEIEQLRELLAA